MRLRWIKEFYANEQGTSRRDLAFYENLTVHFIKISHLLLDLNDVVHPIARADFS